MSGLSVPKSVQAAVADVYRGVFTLPFEVFKETTLRRLQSVLPFDSAVWGSGVHSTNELFSLSAVDQSFDTLMTYAAKWQPHDFVRSAAVANPGRALRNEDVMPLERYHASDIYLEFSKPAGIEHALGVAERDEVTDVGDVVFLFRADPRRAFTAEDVALLEHLSPHLVLAWRQCQIAHHYRLAASGAAAGFHDSEGYAVASNQGVIQAAGEDFRIAVCAAAPAWRGPKLPPAFDPLLNGARSTIVLGDYEFTVQAADERRLFAVAARAGTLGLTPTEARVARLYAGDMTQRDIATRAGVSVSTVRNQLSSVYLKLDVHSKIGLARVLNRLRG
ncbi:helix-turn-helix transcriptional regulator [Phenylobacterium sp.]|uniref:helix-turn-helix transcriptional regulator n=1 Tax=Phenylobacterium sp. TaxID=1871053 RepID=UPI003568EF3C